MEDLAGRNVPDSVPAPLSHAYDLGALKTVDNIANPEIRFRLVFLALASLALTWALGQSVVLLWFLAYGAALVLHLLAVQRAPRLAPPVWVLRIRITAGLSAIAYVWLGLYLWTRPETVFQHLSILLLLAGMLNTLSRRSCEPILLLCDLIADAAGVLLRIGWLWLIAPFTASSALLSVALLLTYGYYIVTCLDVARTQRALDSAKQQEAANDKYNAIGRLTAGFAHDFNNMLQAILGHAELSRHSIAESDRQGHLAQAEAAARRGAQLTSRLLDLSQKAKHTREHITIATLRTDLDELADMLLDPSQRVQWEAEPDLPPIRADRARLLRAIENVLRNAVDATPAGGTIRIATRRGRDGMLMIEIGDSGNGIGEELLNLVFEPYFTTKPMGRGTGLGLPEARGIVEQTGGRIGLSSTEGQGTVVTLEVPFA